MRMNNPKQEAAERAVERVSSGMVVGLGTGSTAVYAVEAIGRLLAQGALRDIVGIPTSRETESLARRLGIPLATLDEHPTVDITIDGADEVDPAGNMIKGGGGAFLWEKIVAAATQRYVIIVDESKLVQRLGQRSALPVEVMPFGWRTHVELIRALGAEPQRREDANGTPFASDGGHFILDCRFHDGIADPHEAERLLHSRPGVVGTGLFLDMRPEVVVGRSGGA